MANTMRWRYGDTNPVMMPVKSVWIVEIGDLIYQADGVAMPAEALDIYEASVREDPLAEFHNRFVGVAMQQSPSGVEGPIRVATSGVFEFDCEPMTAEVGDLLSPAMSLEEHELTDQKVAKVEVSAQAIGRCAKRVLPEGTRVLVEIVSPVMRGR